MLRKLQSFLDTSLGLGPRLMVTVAALCLVPALFMPLWRLTMFAPQYPEGLRLDIYSYQLLGDHGGQDLKEINLLNHYIGMRDLVADDFTEFKWMPFVIGALGLLFMRAAVFGRAGQLLDVAMLYLYFCGYSLVMFVMKLYRYGHDLAPTAAVKVPPFTPPILGFKQLANFEVYSYPSAGSYGLMGTALMLLLAVAVAFRTFRRAARS